MKFYEYRIPRSIRNLIINEYRIVLFGHCGVGDDECDQQATPSASCEPKLSMRSDVEEDIPANNVRKKLLNECVVNNTNDYCEIHECAARMLAFTTKKWKWKPRKKEYGYVSVRTKRLVCSGAWLGPGTDQSTHVEPAQTSSAQCTRVLVRPTADNYGGAKEQTIGHPDQQIGGQGIK